LSYGRVKIPKHIVLVSKKLQYIIAASADLFINEKVSGVLIVPFELFFKSNLSLPRLGGAALYPVHQSALLGQGLLWRSLGRSLLANFKACAALLRLLA